MRLKRGNRGNIKEKLSGECESYVHLDEVLDIWGKWYAHIMRSNGTVP